LHHAIDRDDVAWVEANDPPTFVTVSLLLLSTAVIASWIPAHRASVVHLLVALRAG
jgi:ABC-type lipoprotein release transport system permease subunit